MNTTPRGPAPEPAAQHRIVRHARQHFFMHGFRTVTMDDLARELGMSKKTLYAHFPSKTALVRAVVESKFAELGSDFDKITATAPESFTGALRALLETLRRHLDEIQPSFVRDIQRETPDLFRDIQVLRQQHIHRHFGRLFQAGRRAGLIRKDVPAEVMIEILLGAVDGLVTPDKLQRLHLTPKEAFMALVTVVLEGVLTEKGRP